MPNDFSFTALSRALFELRSGRAIALDGRAFLPWEEGEASGETISAEGMDMRFTPEGSRNPEGVVEQLMLTLLKRAGLLPVAVLTEQADEDFAVQRIEEALEEQSFIVKEVARAQLPMKATKDAQIVSFKQPGSAAEHLAMVIGKPEQQEAPLVRVHSSCITGDLLGSLRCDCGDQLALALDQIAGAGHGVVCYLQQEGRGIGITNKIHAYALQEEGVDTLDANLALGFAADERDFGVAAAMLQALEVDAVTLLSNNPDKKAQLSRYGVKVAAQVPLQATPTEENIEYLNTKRERFGHLT